MKHIYITLAVAALLTATGGAHAQQQQFERDSVYAVQGKSSKPSAPAPVRNVASRNACSAALVMLTRCPPRDTARASASAQLYTPWVAA